MSSARMTTIPDYSWTTPARLPSFRSMSLPWQRHGQLHRAARSSDSEGLDMTNPWANSRSMALVDNPGYLPLSGSMNAPSSTEDRLPRDPDPIAPERQAYVTASRAQLPRGQYILDQSLAPIRAARALDGPRRRILQDAECRGNATTDTCASPSVWPEAVTTIVQGEIDAIASMFGGRVRTVPATTKTAWSSRASSIVSGRAPGALTISSVMGSFPTGCRDGKSSSSRSPSRRTISVPLML